MGTSKSILLRVGLALAVLIAAGLLVFLITLAFLGLGTLFSRLFELTLFEATVVTLLGAVILTFLVPLIRALFFAPEGEEYEEMDEEDWYDEDWDDDDWDGDGQEADASFLSES